MIFYLFIYFVFHLNYIRIGKHCVFDIFWPWSSAGGPLDPLGPDWSVGPIGPVGPDDNLGQSGSPAV